MTSTLQLGIECYSRRVVGNLNGSMNTFWPPTNPTGPSGNLNGSVNKDQRVYVSTLYACCVRDILASKKKLESNIYNNYNVTIML